MNLIQFEFAFKDGDCQANKYYCNIGEVSAVPEKETTSQGVAWTRVRELTNAMTITSKGMRVGYFKCDVSS